MKRLPLKGRTLALLGVVIPLLALFVYVVFRSGPLASVPVTATTVDSRAIAPALFGLGTIEARYTYKIGPTMAGRVQRVDVQVGDRVRAGQVLGEMDPVDFDERIAAQIAALKSAEAGVLTAEARMQEVSARQHYAETQARRYEQLLKARSVSEEDVENRQQEFQMATASLATAQAGLEMARQELSRARANLDVLIQQKANLRLIAPADGLVTIRHADPATTVVAGQAVLEVIDPTSLWINVRFDQLRAAQLRGGLPARIVLRSQEGKLFSGQVLRVEPVADTVTEETLAKVVFAQLPTPLPPLGELAEVTVALPELSAALVVPNASVKRIAGQLGVWLLQDGAMTFAPIKAGASDLDGQVQVLDGLELGAQVVVYSQRALSAHTRIKVVAHSPGGSP
ncbi:MAG: efflux RND transporter periplasmic adaptor subunit [Opitutaceae bacterium]|nr:efflux RND transporter periplasmic adaptor subunit [Opitutaceae bacterium]MBP9913391.1 efflux RND transporter periplasmic adaptor subunit [Opitutaceae bacterium]